MSLYGNLLKAIDLEAISLERVRHIDKQSDRLNEYSINL